MSRDSSGLWAPIEAPPPAPELSVVVPLRDEEASVPLLADEVEAALDGAGLDWECIWVDDGSRDGSRGALEALARRRPEHRWIGLAPGVGQSGALVAGFREARAPLLATLDADLQNDPADLPRLLEALGDGDVDMVNGVRAGRRDTWVRRVSSRIANGFRNRVTGESVTDVGCAVRVFRADLVAAVPAFRGMHRFLPTLLRLRGARIVEVPVAHRPRRTGRTHYGIHNRLWVGLLDTFGVWWLKRRWVEPRPAARSPVAAAARRAPDEPRPPRRGLPPDGPPVPGVAQAGRGLRHAHGGR